MGARSAGVVLALTLLAALVRFPTLGVQSYSLDEAVTAVKVLDPDFLETLRNIPASESTPPLYYVLAWLWSRLFGIGEVGLRSLSALFGTATVPASYWLGATLISRRVGTVLAALIAVHPLLVWFSQEARAYALLVLLSALALVYFVKALREPTARNLAVWALISSLGLTTHYFAVFLVAPQAVWLLKSKVPTSARRATAAAIAGVAATGLALTPLALHQAADNRSAWIAAMDLGERIEGLARDFLVGPGSEQLPLVVPAAGALMAMGVLLLWLHGDGPERRGAQLALIVAGAAIFLPLGLSFLGLDRFVARNVLAAIVPLWLIPAAGFGGRRAGRVGLGLAAVLCALLATIVSVAAREPQLQRDDWRSVASAIRAPLQTSAIVTPPPASPPLRFYLPPGLHKLKGGRRRLTDVVVVTTRESPTFAPLRGFEVRERRPFRHAKLIWLHSDLPRRVSRPALAATLIGPDEVDTLIYSHGRFP